MVDALIYIIYDDKNNINFQMNDQYTYYMNWYSIYRWNTIRLTQFNTTNARGNVSIDFQIHST